MDIAGYSIAFLSSAQRGDDVYDRIYDKAVQNGSEDPEQETRDALFDMVS